MKFNFRKVSAIASSLLMVGMTAGVAAAANYPSPFVVGGSADVAIVYGTGAGVSTLDAVQSGSIQTNLQSFVSGGGTSVSGGDSFKFEKTSTKFWLGNTIIEVIPTSLDEDELPTLLADGKFVDNDNDEFDFTQKIEMAPSTLSMFENNDYAEDEPTIGFMISSGTNVLNYTITFSDEPLLMDLATSDLVLMGKTYYILSNNTGAANMILTLLDAAEDTVLTEGSSAVVSGKTVTIDFISETEVALIVDGESTNSLQESETQKLTDGSYVGVKDIRYSSKKGTLSSVEFSIGSGKLKLTSGSDIQVNDDSVSGLSSEITNTSGTPSTAKLTSIKLIWEADDDLFITETSSISLPKFESVKMSFGGLNYPVEEMIRVQQGGDLYASLEDFPLKNGPADIDFLYGTASNFSELGKDSTNKLLTGADGVELTFNDASVHDYFVASWSSTSDAESYLMRFNNIRNDGSDNKTDLEYYKDGVWTDKKTGIKNNEAVSIGSVDLNIINVSKAGSTRNVIFTNNSASTNFNTLYSATGLKVNLPVINASATNISSTVQYAAGAACVNATAVGVISNTSITDIYTGALTYNATGNQTETYTTCALPASFVLQMFEEDKNGNIAAAAGDTINVTLGWDSSATPEVEVSTVVTENDDATSTEIGDTDVWRDFTYSALATEILYNKPSSGQRSVKIMYHGDEVAADVYITSQEAVISATPGGALGDVLVKDSEVSSVSSKNLIVVGGSCINSVAANLVGGALCGSAWTTSTGVGSGQFLIQSFGDAYTTGKVALLVAGYEAADTTNAGTYLRTQLVDTAAGKKYLGTSSTSATLQVS